jgi:phenylacetic acid degradation operon negative regulatory protein
VTIVQVRTAFFTIFGDYILHDGGMVTMPELTELLSCFDFSEEAVKAAIFRMRHQNIVKSRRIDGRTYYSLEDEALQRLEEGMKRTFRDPDGEEWDGMWTVLIYSLPESERKIRDQFRREIGWYGFGQLTPGTWISPNRWVDPLFRIIRRHGIEKNVQLFASRHLGPLDESLLVDLVWDLQSIQDKYAAFIEEFAGRFEQPLEQWDDRRTFKERVMLLHEYRKFLHIDPQLPGRLLPDGWLGHRARDLFWRYYRALAPGAERFYREVKARNRKSGKMLNPKQYAGEVRHIIKP